MIIKTKKSSGQAKFDFLNQHRRPMTRREFVSLGLMGAGATVLAPTLLSMIKMKSALANELEFASNYIPFITLDLAGGAGLPGNFLVGGNGGAEDLLPSYSTLGWNPKSGYDKRFGLPMAKPEVSKIFAGMLSIMSPEAQAKFRMSSVLHTAQDDTNSNPLSLMTVISKGGLRGSTLGSLGLTNSTSGSNSRATIDAPDFKPQYIGKLDDLLQMQSGHASLQKLGKDRLLTLIKSLSKTSSTQASTILGEAPQSEKVQGIVNAFGGVQNKLENPINFDARQDATAQAIYGINPNTNADQASVVRASVTRLALMGVSGGAAITIGGCDYHDGTQTTGDNKDQEIGVEIGRMVEFAHRMKKPLFIHIITDGGVSSNGGRNWSSDSGDRCMSVMGYYRPDRAPEYRSPLMTQLGAYTSGQGASKDTIVGGGPAVASAAVFANYMSLCGQEAAIPNHFPGMNTETINQYLAFN